MRLLYLTAHLSDADLAQRALDRLSPPVRVEACASVKDVLQALGTTPVPDAVLVDTAPPTHDPLRALADLRAAAPELVLLALVRPGADALTAEALVAGADDALPKQKEFYLQAPAAVARVLARRPPVPGDAAPPRVLVVAPDAHPAVSALADLRVTQADDSWWTTPAEQTQAARPDVLVLTDARGPAGVAAAVKALRDQTVPTPVVLLTGETPPPLAMCERLGVAAVLGEHDIQRLPDVVRAAAATARLAAQVAVLRAKEQRLRAIIESVPASVVLVGADATVLAMNVAGLAVVGARGASDIVGRSLLTLCDAAASADLRAFVTRVCQGAPGLARFPGRGLDGAPKTFEIRAVPMAREQDTTVLLGAMRVAVSAATPAPARQGVAAEVELPLAAVGGSPDADAIRAELESLRGTLTREQAAHAEVRDRLAEAGVREAVHEVAWSAIQAELQRKLILQASLPDRLDEHERTRALLEQTVRERDQQLLTQNEALQAAEASLRQAGEQLARLQDEVRTHEEDAASMRAALEVTSSREQHLLRVVAERDAELGQLREQLASAQQAAADSAAEVQALRQAAEEQRREHLALVDVRQQVARLQAAAVTVEQQQRALDDAHDQMQRLREALEEALGTHTDLERRLREREAALEAALAERDRQQDRLREVEAELAATLARADGLRAEANSDLQRQLADARSQLSLVTGQLREASDARALADAARVELDAARTEMARLLTRALAAEDQAARVPDLHAQVEEWRARHEAVQVELEALLGDLAEARRRGDQVQHLAAELSAARAALAEARAEAEAANTRAREATEATEATRQALADAQERALQQSAEAERRLAAVTAAREAAEAEVAEQARRVLALQADLDAARTDVAALQAARNDAQTALARAREAHAALEAFGAAAAAARDDALGLVAERDGTLGQLRAALDTAATEGATLRNALSEAEQARARDTALIDDLRARVAALEADLATRQSALDEAARTEALLRAAAAEAAVARDAAEQALASARDAQRAVLDDQQSLRDQIDALQAQLATERQLAAELDAERAALREKLARADASSQLLASRQREAQEDLERMAAELRARLADLEASAAADRAALQRLVDARDAALRRLSQSGVVGLATTTPDGALLRCNEAFAAFCGLEKADDLLQRAANEGLPLVTNWPAFAALVASASAPVTVDACVQRSDGSVAWLQASAAAGDPGPPGPTLEWTIVDATDRYLRLRQQRQHRRLESVRDLAVSAGGELVEALATPAALPGVAPLAASDARLRAREIAQQLVAFARKQARPAHLVDLGEQLTHLRLALARLTGDDVSLTVEVASRPLVVTADPAELDQWITSLCVVLRDALPAVGALAVTAGPRDLVLGASTGSPRVTPVATLALRATGYGVRAVTVPTALADAVAQRGGTTRATHDAIAAQMAIELHLPLVSGLSASEAPFPLSVQVSREAPPR